MKTLLFICLTLFISSFAFAGEWVPESKIKPPHSIKKLQSVCMTESGELCFDKAGKDMRGFKVGFRAIAVLQTLDCVDGADCQAKLDALPAEFGCPDLETASFDDKVNWPTLDFVAESRPATGFFLWCQAKILVTDAAGASAATAADNQTAADKSTRDSARGPRETSLQACVQDSKNPTLTPAQIKDCIAALVRETLGNKVAPADL